MFRTRSCDLCPPFPTFFIFLRHCICRGHQNETKTWNLYLSSKSYNFKILFCCGGVLNEMTPIDCIWVHESEKAEPAFEPAVHSTAVVCVRHPEKESTVYKCVWVYDGESPHGALRKNTLRTSREYQNPRTHPWQSGRKRRDLRGQPDDAWGGGYCFLKKKKIVQQKWSKIVCSANCKKKLKKNCSQNR